MKIVGITGGIGAGKSVVARILAAIGYPVYDCDYKARVIMDGDDDIKRRLAREISRSVVDECGNIDRKALAEIVFNDDDKLKILNSIVHSAVKRDFSKWCQSQASNIVFVETAILKESGLDAMVDDVWVVEASRQKRIERVMLRNNLSKEQVEARISSQNEIKDETYHYICNDSGHSLLLQVSKLLAELKKV